MSKITMEELVNYAKNYGFVFQGSEIYGGLANTWDYGPLGAELKKNIKDAWWKKFIQEESTNVGLDSSILLNPKTWEASGHIGGFADPLTDCKQCHARHRADKLIEDFDSTIADGWTNEEMLAYINKHKIVCPVCGALDYTEIRDKVSQKKEKVIYTYVQKRHKVFFLILNMYNVQCVRKFLLELAKLEKVSVMKLPQETLFLEPVNLNKWNLNFFVNHQLNLDGLTIIKKKAPTF